MKKTSIAFSAAFALISHQGFAAVLIDQIATSTASGNSTSSFSSNSYTSTAFSVANNSDRMLAVAIGLEDDPGSITSITWDGVALTQAQFAYSSSSVAQIWYLDNPNAVTNGTLTVTGSLTASGDPLVLSFFSLYNVAGIGPAGSNKVETTSTDDASLTLSVAPGTGSFGIDVGTTQNALNTVGFGAGQTGAVTAYSSTGGFTSGISYEQNYDGTMSQTWTSTGGRIAYASAYFTAIPEPGSAAMLIGGMGAFAMIRRRRRD